MSVNGVRLFRYALLFEMGANMVGIVPLLFAPEIALRFMLKDTSQITPATKTLMQWLGVLILAGFTTPLALSYPNPVPSQGGSEQVVAWRRLTYIMLGCGEAGLGTMLLINRIQGNSGMSDNFLLGGVGSMGAFLGLRAYFLFARPSYMEAQTNARKAK